MYLYGYETFCSQSDVSDPGYAQGWHRGRSKLQNIGLRVDALDPTSIIHPSVEYDVLKVVGQDIQPEQGLLIGQHYALAGYGPLLMLLVTSPTVRDAMHQVIRFQQLTHLTGQLGVEQSEYRSALCYYPKNGRSSGNAGRAS